MMITVRMLKRNHEGRGPCAFLFTWGQPMYSSSTFFPLSECHVSFRFQDVMFHSAYRMSCFIPLSGCHVSFRLQNVMFHSVFRMSCFIPLSGCHVSFRLHHFLFSKLYLMFTTPFTYATFYIHLPFITLLCDSIFNF